MLQAPTATAAPSTEAPARNRRRVSRYDEAKAAAEARGPHGDDNVDEDEDEDNGLDDDGRKDG